MLPSQRARTASASENPYRTVTRSKRRVAYTLARKLCQLFTALFGIWVLNIALAAWKKHTNNHSNPVRNATTGIQ
eukprot:21178-Heterococcus_DN1.PRE.4